MSQIDDDEVEYVNDNADIDDEADVDDEDDEDDIAIDDDDDVDVCCASGRHRIKPLTSARLLSLWATTPPDFARILSSSSSGS